MNKFATVALTTLAVVSLVACGGGGAEGGSSEGVSSDASMVSLGGSFDLGDVTFTANHFLDGWVHPSNPFDNADEGNKAVVLNMTVNNGGAEDFSELYSSFSLKFGEEVYEPTNYVGVTDDAGLNKFGASVEVAAGAENTGELVYEVPEGTDVSAPTMVFEPLFGDDGAQEFSLN